MGKTTMVYFNNNFEEDYRILRTSSKKIEILYVEAFKNGIATISPIGGYNINDFAEVLAGCFEEDSNFASELLRAYECDENTTFKGIQFTFNDATVTVTKENAEASRIYEEWNAIMNKNYEKHCSEKEAWLKTPEGQKMLDQQREEEKRKKEIKEKVLEIDETVEMEFKDDESKKIWDNFVEANSKDLYGMGVIIYARRWAKYMQKIMEKGKTVIQIADKASCDCDIEGITGFMYGCAVNVLVQS